MMLKNLCDTLSNILNKHVEIFNDELGTLKGMKAKLIVKDDAKTKFCKARSVPFAIKETAEKEISHLEETEVISPVTVIVPKPDGSIRVCGDYKSTINPFY